jgi:hypothetical protein
MAVDIPNPLLLLDRRYDVLELATPYDELIGFLTSRSCSRWNRAFRLSRAALSFGSNDMTLTAGEEEEKVEVSELA